MIKVFTAFSGYDSQCLALDSIGIEYELVGWSEIDKYAIKAHDALFPQWSDRNYGDISKIDWAQVPDFDLFTYSSPCQDFSQAGKQKGAEKGSGTRSSLLWECDRAIEAKKPKYLLFENVAAVVSSKFIRLFNEWQLTLEKMGYTNFVQVLNAKTHGYPTPVPQNRERVFMVSIRDCDQAFYFPEAQPLTQRLVDVLDPEVDESYYLSQHTIDSFNAHKEKQLQKGNTFGWNPTDGIGVACTLRAHANDSANCNFIKEEIKEQIVLGWTRDEKGNVVDRHPVEVANAVTAAKRDNTQNYVLQPINTTADGCASTLTGAHHYSGNIVNPKRGQKEMGVVVIPANTADGQQMMELGGVCDLSYPSSKTRRGRVQDGGSVTPTLTTHTENALRRIESDFRIRKLTERECFRLMGVSDADIDKIQAAGISKSQQYKMAGNSIVVNCIAAIFRQLLIGNDNKNQQLELF